MNTEEKVIELAEKLGSKIAELSAQYGQPTIDLVLNVTRINAAQNLFVGLVCTGIAVLALKHTPMLAKRAMTTSEDAEASFSTLSAIIVGCVGATCAMLGFVLLIDIFNWIGLFMPEVVLAKKLLKL